MSAEKRKGDAFERDVVRVFNDHGFPYAERALGLGRHDDRGDVAGVPGFLIDAKNCARLELAVWIDEAINEAQRTPSAHGWRCARADHRGETPRT